MTVMVKRWYRSRRNQMLVFLVLLSCLIYYTAINRPEEPGLNLDITRRYVNISTTDPFWEYWNKPEDSERYVNISTTDPFWEYWNKPEDSERETIIDYIEKRLQEALKADKGTGCEIPHLDPFAKEAIQFDKELPKVTCQGQDWVTCYLSECRVKQEILDTTVDVLCTYSDIIYESDLKYHIGSPVDVYGAAPYILNRSDHVKVRCTGTHVNSILPSKWVGLAVGYRNSVSPPPPPPGREHTYNVLIFGFDSTSKNGFIRRMPKSYHYLMEEMKATVLNGYNIVGDGTPAALFPILSGKTELEMPDVRKKMRNKNTLDVNTFIFSKLRADGYQTVYFEDSPSIGTFQYRFNGFNQQPADHYLRAFFLEDGKTFGKNKAYCVGDTPRYRLMMNLTEQFMKMDGKKYCFTFIADITHDDFNMISTADEDTVEFLKNFKESGRTKDTILFVMGDHGPRYSTIRSTLQGRLEERLPLMAVRLPDALAAARPRAAHALRANAAALATPHDIYATVLDALGLTHLWNPYKLQGADLPRGMTLLEPIPKNRSCSEAGIEPHWCACVSWQPLPPDDPMYRRAADALVAYINELTETARSKCVPRTLTSISWVMKQRPSEGVLSFREAKDADGYVGAFGPSLDVPRLVYQAKITVGPGEGVFEASMTYTKADDRFELDIRDISRTNMYNHEPDCIHLELPHLNMFCYCKDQAT